MKTPVIAVLFWWSVVCLMILGIIFLPGCIEHKGGVDVSGGADFTVDVELTHPRYKMVNGIIYTKYGPDCIAIDSSTLYPEDWVSIEHFDESRETDYTAEEIKECL